MVAAGIDLGGTKIEVQVFDDAWQVVARNRVDTPDDYVELVAEMAAQIGWADEIAGRPVPLGIALPGLIDPISGRAFMANLAAHGHPFERDVKMAAQRDLQFINDCRALALSEAIFGAGRGFDCVLSLILGTGIGGGIALLGSVWEGQNKISGEFGHTPLPAHVVQKYDLPILQCGCGRMGCVETLIAGPGLMRLAKLFTGQSMSPPDLIQARESDPKCQQVWNIWCTLTGELIHGLILSVDPGVIVVGGGLSKIANLTEDLTKTLEEISLQTIQLPKILVAEGGDASGARGAAYAAAHQSDGLAFGV